MTTDNEPVSGCLPNVRDRIDMKQGLPSGVSATVSLLEHAATRFILLRSVHTTDSRNIFSSITTSPTAAAAPHLR